MGTWAGQDHPRRNLSECIDWLYGWCYGVKWTPEELRGALRVLAELRRIQGKRAALKGGV